MADRVLLVGGAEIGQDSDREEFYRRAAALIGDFFQLKNLGVLFGAGPSYPLGSPQIREVTLADINRMVASSRGSHLDEEAERLVAATIQAAGGTVDLEELLAFLGSARAIMSSPFGGDGLRFAEESVTVDALQEVQSALNHGLAVSCDLPGEGGVDDRLRDDPLLDHRTFFRKLLATRRPDLPRLNVFTVNYDLLIEKALDQLEVPFVDGFQGGIERFFRQSTFDQDVYLPPDMEQRRMLRVPDMLYLFKLHGSVNWRIRDESGVVRVVQTSQPRSFREGELALVFPTPQKELDALGYPYSALLRSFSEVVNQPDCGLLVVGYGFADDHINRIIEEGLGNPTFQLLVVTPSRESDRLKELSRVADPRIRFLSGSESGLFRHLAQDAMPDLPEPELNEATRATQAAFREAVGTPPDTTQPEP